MIVDDAKDVREFFTVALTDAGYRVLSAASARHAMRILRAGTAVDAIVVDYKLGDVSGTALIHQARNERLVGEMPVLICTAYQYLVLPPNVGIMHKPIAEADLIRQIGDLVGGPNT